MKIYSLIFFVLVYSCADKSNKSCVNPIKPSLELTNHLYKKRSTVEFAYSSELHFKDKYNNQQHIYYVYLKNFTELNDNVTADMLNEGKSKPYEVNGLTVILFFNKKEGETLPVIVKENSWFIPDIKYSKSCVSGYFHYPKGSEETKSYPLKINI